MRLKQFRTPALISFLSLSAGIFAGLLKTTFLGAIILLLLAIFFMFAKIFPYWFVVLLGFLYVKVDLSALQNNPLKFITGRKAVLFGEIVDNRFVRTDSIRFINGVFYSKVKLFMSSKTSIGCGKVKLTGIIRKDKGDFAVYLISNRAIGSVYPITFKRYPDKICSIRRYIQNVLRNYSWDRVNFEIFRALLLGERQEISQKVIDIFKRTGTMHILALSGLHIGIITLIIFSFVSIFRVGEEFSLVLTAIVLTLYLFLVGFKSSLFRAYLFFISLIIAKLSGRKINYLNVWGFAGLTSLIYNPLWLLNIGFQFSYLATLGIILSLKLKLGGVPGYIVKLFLTSLMATMFVSPLQIYYFKIFTPISILANIFVIPLVFIVLSELIIGVILAVIQIGFLGTLFFNVANFALKILLWILKIFEKLPGAYVYDRSPINAYQVAILIVFFIILMVGVRRMISEVQEPR